MYHKQWSQLGYFGFNVHTNPSFVSVSSAEEFIGAESKMLCFRLKCIAKFAVFPELELTLLKANFTSSSISVGISETKMPPNRRPKR